MDKDIAVVKEIEKPIFNEELKAEIIGKSEIEDNIKELKEYALKVQDYYKDVVFTPETQKEAEEEKASINKLKAKVADFRKQIVAEYKKPIDLFETTAKETEKILESTYKLINDQVSLFNQAELEKVSEKLKTYFNEYAMSKGIDFIQFEQLGLSVTKGCLTATGSLTKKTETAITDFIDSVENDLKLINTLEFKDEVLIEYKKTLKCANAIAEVQDRHAQLEKIEEEKKKVLEDNEVVEKIEYVTAPKKDEPIVETQFKVRATLTKIKELKDFMDRGGYDYE